MKNCAECERLRKKVKELEKLSITDSLTNLYNQRHFYKSIEMETAKVNRYSHKLSLLLFDIDNFKHFNDTFGHVEGDSVLTRFGCILLKNIRKTDLAFRYGGDEFLVLLPETDEIEAKKMADRICEEYCLSVSVGISEYQKNESINSFMNRVDSLMYKDKKNDGR